MNSKLPGADWDSGEITADTTGPARQIRTYNMHGYQVYGSAPVGIFSLEVSINGDDWTELSTHAVTADGMVYFDCWVFTYVRWKWVKTSGTVEISETHSG